MGTIINLTPHFEEDPDIYAMDRGELEQYLAQLREKIELLDEQEPDDMESEAYEVWGEQHEDLEDLADEILELLDELN